ncbi:HU family DNA-binding protein [Ottowia sp.]|uniref:HU family DNA-binding protein n=1 Tax=Ottowia sp. TaxID=1898956 RepID=UPI0025DC3F43|nr:HU family DNA-binding protein [Ottowia sp.]MBK6616212.1 hypothetical protein [Ottowia sp.]
MSTAYQRELAALLALELGCSVDAASSTIASLCTVITRALREDIPVTLPGVLTITTHTTAPRSLSGRASTRASATRRRVARVRIATHLEAAIAAPSSP